ncbi:MAG: outer membrane beta-barrel protein [Thermoanaerobaculia bacterium]|nr:outer membrane beta-barrel protein [Thermoanaerobaculia bacterium]MBP9824814.1 outer membrane beta-barrel protein [Thermoanaerobaculia bacterium]
MRRISSWKFIALFTLLLAPAAFAQDADYTNSPHVRGRFELTPTVSYNFGGTLSGEESDFFDFELEADDSEAFGVTFGIPLSPWAQIELLASRQQTELAYDDGLFGGNIGVADFDVSYYHVGGLFQWGNGQVHPFFVASLGVANLNPDVPGASAENKFSGSIGGGVKIFLTDNIGLRFEGRGFWTLLDDGEDYYYDDCYHCGDYYDYGYSNTFDQAQFSTGLIIAW